MIQVYVFIVERFHLGISSNITHLSFHQLLRDCVGSLCFPQAFGFSANDTDFLLEALIEGNNITVKNMNAGKIYHFRVRALNDVGAGNWSNIVEIIAAASVTSAPGPLTVISTSPRSIEMEWSRPEDNHGSPPLMYLLQMQKMPRGNATVDPNT
jgi:hypothetical protein